MADKAPEAGSRQHADDAATVYDLHELELLIGLSFSAGELSQFAQHWQVFTAREASARDGARTLARTLASRGKIHDLVVSLRTHKPLVQWPAGQVKSEPSPDSMPKDDPPEKAQAQPASSEAQPASSIPSARPIEETLPGDDARAGNAPRQLLSPGQLQGSAEEALQPTELVTPPAAAASSAATASERLLDPYLTPSPAPTPPTSSGRRWLPMSLVLLVGLALGALATGIYRRGDAARPKTKEGGTSLALLAASSLDDSIQALAETCGVSADDNMPQSARALLTAAFERCGRTPPGVGKRTGRLGQAIPQQRPRSQPKRPRRRRTARPRATISRAASCLDRCHAVHQTCAENECGAEPGSANQYGDYQRCMTGCLSKYSRCRLSCR